jgi:hypothetical protein
MSQPGNIPHNTVTSSISRIIDSSVVRSNYLLEGFFYWHSVFEQTSKTFNNISIWAVSIIWPCGDASPSKERGICDAESTNAQT